MTTTETTVKPVPPAPPVLDNRPAPPAAALFRFQFKKQYGGLYSNRHDKFVLREEHIAELKRLVREHNGEYPGRTEAISLSDIVNAALDLALEHPMAFQYRATAATLRDALGREVYRRAFLHFMRHEVL
ncbi:MAG: hypothetical protein PHF00_07205 [Elusimicrobia bacterium]|nr:hypothetical protein [Elusimicrobiota bacterium]